MDATTEDDQLDLRAADMIHSQHDPRHTGGPSATSATEWRVDTSDGCAYTKVEFERFYGFYSGTCKWKAALQATPAPRQYRDPSSRP